MSACMAVVNNALWSIWSDSPFLAHLLVVLTMGNCKCGACAATWGSQKTKIS